MKGSLNILQVVIRIFVALLSIQSSQSYERSYNNNNDNICGIPATSRGLKIVKLLLQHSSSNSLASASSPQHQAMCWLIHQDPKKVSVPMFFNTNKLLQRYALAVLYSATNGSTKWLDKTNWLSKKSECEWYGIGCNVYGYVTMVDLPFNELEGILPREISILKYLQILEVQANELQGVIPMSLGECKELTILKLFMNGFFGEIPSSIGKLKHLKEFITFGTYLMGTIPKEIGHLHKLEMLDLYGNNFSGTVPTTIKQLKNIQELNLNDNNFVGTIPVLPKKPIEMWADCRAGSDGRAEVKCEQCTHCCHDKANPKCVARKTSFSSNKKGKRKK